MSDKITVFYGDGKSKEIDNTRLGDFLKVAADRGVEVHSAIPSASIAAGKDYSQDQSLESVPSSVANGLAQGVTGGFLDEGAAGVRALAKKLPDALDAMKDDAVQSIKSAAQHPLDETKKEFSDLGNLDPLAQAKKALGDEYDKQLAAGRAKRDLAKNANPKTYEAADLVGGLIGNLIAGGKAPALAAGSVEGHSDDKDANTALQAIGAGALAGAAPKAGAVAGNAIGHVKDAVGALPIVGSVLSKLLPTTKAEVVAKLAQKAGPLVSAASGTAKDAMESPAELTPEQKARLYQAIAETLKD